MLSFIKGNLIFLRCSLTLKPKATTCANALLFCEPRDSQDQRQIVASLRERAYSDLTLR